MFTFGYESFNSESGGWIFQVVRPFRKDETEKKQGQWLSLKELDRKDKGG